MPGALVIYAVFLLIEGGLAWLVTGNPFLLSAVTCGVLFYSAVWKRRGPWGELVRALAAGIIALAGPFSYKAELLPTLLCFLALPHLLATTQCFWEIALGKNPVPQNVRMRTLVFTVAFYAAMGLVFVLLRGAEQVSGWVTGPLSLLVLVLAIPAWDLARVTRLKPGQAKVKASAGLKLRRMALVAAVMSGIAVLFSGVLPAAAEKLCAVSPRWKIKADSPGNLPPHQDKPAPRPSANGAAQRPGLDSSAVTGRHELPRQSDLKAIGEVMLYLRPHQRSEAVQLAQGAVYVRSHSLDEWKDGAWQSSVQGGQWLEDAADGQADGVVSLSAAAPESIAHTIFLQNADGYTLPALQNVTAIGLPRIYRLSGEVHQVQAAGDIRYDAVSSPRNWAGLPNRELLRAGGTGNPAHTSTPDSQVMTDLIYSNASFDRQKVKSLALQVEAVKTWLAQNIHYSTVMKGESELSPLDNFLVDEKRGYCDFYATAGALMLRYFGVSARVAYGYAGNDYDERDGVFTFTDESAHAWTEVFVEGHGWTICDFTPPANIGNLGGRPPQPRPPFDESAFAGQAGKKPAQTEQKPPEEFSLSAWWNDMMARLSALDPVERTKQILTWLAGAAVLYFLLRMLRGKKSAGAAGEDHFTGDGQQPAYFAEFVRVFQGAGVSRVPGSTPREYLGAVRRRGLAGAEFDPMMDYHYARRYEDAEMDREREEAWLAGAREAEERLRRNARGS